jgi:hypothetical protein
MDFEVRVEQYDGRSCRPRTVGPRIELTKVIYRVIRRNKASRNAIAPIWFRKILIKGAARQWVPAHRRGNCEVV